MAKVEQIVQFVRPLIEQAGYGLWDVEYQKEGNQWYLRVFISHSQGVTMEDCLKIHEALAPILELKDPIPRKYILEISSPGIDRTLKTVEHFKQSIGETVQIKLFEATAGQKKHMGQLVAATDEGLELLLENQEQVGVAYQKVAKAQIVF